jgi:monoamine oxidase
MSRTPALAAVKRALTLAAACERRRIPTAEGLERLAEAEGLRARRGASRRRFLERAGRLAVAGSLASVAGPLLPDGAAHAQGSTPSVGIVGAGLAGLACADELRAAGIRATLYEASDRVGGRCATLRGLFPGQVAERGGEFIDTLHTTMLGYARRFGLAREDVTKQPGEVAYFFGGRHVPEATVVDEYRDFVATMRADLRALSTEVTADSHTDADARLDRISLLAYLDGQNARGQAAGPIVKAAIVEAYEAEYGRAAGEQSCLNFLLFIHADKRSKFTPFGVFSDERYHLIDGNDAIVRNLAGELSGQIQLGMLLRRVRKTGDGRIELTFARDARSVAVIHDAIVLAIPFTTLRGVELDASLGLPAWKRKAIVELGYGTNAKMMVGFAARPWAAQGSSGASYSDLADHQATWETNPARAAASSAILTDYSSGPRGARLDPRAPQREAARFLGALDRVYPGSSAAAARPGGAYRVHLEHWPSNPLALGSYTCYTPGQFTTLAGNEGKRVGNLHFAGEHANSFYEWQGFMEGAALSGIQAAAEILADVKAAKPRR